MAAQCGVFLMFCPIRCPIVLMDHVYHCYHLEELVTLLFFGLGHVYCLLLTGTGIATRRSLNVTLDFYIW